MFRHTIHMKRTNLVLDESKLEKAKAILAAPTYSDAVNQALSEVIRLAYLRGLTASFGQGVWAGDLGKMREDRPLEGSKRRKKTRRKT